MIKLTKNRKKQLDNISNYRIKLSISKMNILKKHYEGKNNINFCPLCKITTGLQYANCNMCPWYIIMNKKCLTFYEHNKDYSPDIGHARSFYELNPNWTKLRIEQLTNWIKLYKNYLINHR